MVGVVRIVMVVMVVMVMLLQNEPSDEKNKEIIHGNKDNSSILSIDVSCHVFRIG